MLSNSTQRYRLVTTLILLLEDASSCSFKNSSIVVEYLFFHITGTHAVTRMLCMHVFRYTVQRRRISDTAMQEMQRKLDDLISFAHLFECRAIVDQLTQLRRQCFEEATICLSATEQESSEEAILGSLKISCENKSETGNDSSDLLDHVFATESIHYYCCCCSAYEAYCFLCRLGARSLSLTEMETCLQVVLDCGANWSGLFVFVCELLVSFIGCHPALTASDVPIISFIKSSFQKFICGRQVSPTTVWEAHCFLVLMRLAATFCRFAPEYSVVRLGKDALLAECVKSVLCKRYLPEETQRALWKRSKKQLSSRYQETRTQSTQMTGYQPRLSTRLLLSCILEWTESYHPVLEQQGWLFIRRCLDALLLKQSTSAEGPSLW